jgi:hypothetical protein
VEEASDPVSAFVISALVLARKRASWEQLGVVHLTGPGLIVMHEEDFNDFFGERVLGDSQKSG